MPVRYRLDPAHGRFCSRSPTTVSKILDSVYLSSAGVSIGHRTATELPLYGSRESDHHCPALIRSESCEDDQRPS